MSITVEAVYENGVLRPTQPLPLKEHERVRIALLGPGDIPQALSAADRAYGLIRWTGDPEVVRQVAEDVEFSILESP